MARKGIDGKRISKKWGNHLKKAGKRIANKAERRNGKTTIKSR
jgi:hypothetical protein